MTPPDPSPTLDLPAILDRADRLVEARAKATAGPWSERLKDEAAFDFLIRDLAIEEDVRALVAKVVWQAAEISRLRANADRLIYVLSSDDPEEILRQIQAERERLRALLGERATQGRDEVTP